MPNYPGRRKGTRRVVIWHEGASQEWIVEGTKREAEKFEARERLKLQAGKREHRTAVSFSTLFVEYSAHAQAHLKRNTWNVRKYLLANLEEELGELKVDQLALSHIEAYKLDRLETVGARAVNNELMALRASITFGRAAGHPVSDVKWRKLPETGTGRVRCWSGVEVLRLYQSAEDNDPPLLPIFVFLANTGCRKGEAVAAEWSWVDFRRGLICIPVNEYWSPKSGRPREIPLSDALRAELEGPRRSERWLFPGRWGQRLAKFPFLRWQVVQEKAGVAGTPHWFRHTFASHFLAAVPDLFLLAQVLGHSHQRVTELYSHLLPSHLERARNAVNIGPARETMAATMADPAAPPEKRLRLVGRD